MARNVLRLVRGTKAQNRNYTGAVGEPVMATDTSEFYLHDGASAGGLKVGLALQYPRVRLTDLAERIGLQLAGDGVTLEGGTLQQVLAYAAANGIKVTGAGRTFATSASVQYGPGLDVEDLSVTATSTAMGASGRVLLGSGMGANGSVRLYRTRARITGDATLGTVGDSMAFFLTGGARHIIEDLDASAVGKRSLIAIINTVDSDFIRLFAHDGLYDDATVTDDCVQGIWIYGTTGCRLISPRVFNLIGNGALRSGMALPSGVASTSGSRLWTRGLALGVNRDLIISEPQVQRVDQAIDVSGSGGNVNVKINGGMLRDLESHGIKFANTAYRCSAIGTSIERAGRSAVVASGPAGAADNSDVIFTSECSVSNIIATDTGTRSDGSTLMPSFHSAGGSTIIPYRIEMSGYAPGQSYPRGVTFDNCRSRDTQASPRVSRGFSNDVPYTINSKQPNVATPTCSTVGQIDNTNGGFVGFHEPRVELQAASVATGFSVASGTATDIDFSVEIYDPMDLHSLTSNINVVRLEPGVWRSEVSVVWPANATGARQIDTFVNGGVQVALAAQAAGQGVEHVQTAIGQITIPSGSAASVRIAITQTSGGALAVDRTRLFWRLQKLR